MTERDRFAEGVVCALDVVALFGEGTMFREIVGSCGPKEILDEINKNGLERTKEMAKKEFNL